MEYRAIVDGAEELGYVKGERAPFPVIAVVGMCVGRGANARGSGGRGVGPVGYVGRTWVRGARVIV